MKRTFITGSAGFVGFHVARLLLDEGWHVRGFDGMTDYYDINLKRQRHDELLKNDRFTAREAMLEDAETLAAEMRAFEPDVVLHLGAQAGVRYSIENPQAYLSGNVIGTFNVLESAGRLGVRHLLMASTSSVYGGSTQMPYREIDKSDAQLSLYAATKKSAESLAHAWAHLRGLPTTAFRFFTVYGPWGRPDMAYFKFTKAILEGRPIDLYNGGEMWRDFTYIDDLARSICLLIDHPPGGPEVAVEGDSLSASAPFRVVNIGNGEKVRLADFVETIERKLGASAVKRMLPMQPGDVPATWADSSLLERLTGYRPNTKIDEGLDKFVSWYRKQYQV